PRSAPRRSHRGRRIETKRSITGESPAAMAPASQNSPVGARYAVVMNESSRVGLVHEDYALLTPENVELRYPVAGVGSRLIPVSIDYTVLLVAEIVISFALAFTGELVRRLFPPT